MMKTCDEILEAKIAERSERAKKLYRYVTDVARRIDEATNSCLSMSDLFSTQIEVQRQKLRDNCEKLFFLDPLNYGKKSLELLWRKVYYETVSAAKKLKKSDKEYDTYLFTHIVCGIGQFHNLITRIQLDMQIQVKELDYISLEIDEEPEEGTKILSDDELQFGKVALHSCLIYLGDLSRYQVEMFHTFDPSIAARYYLQAAHIDLNSGMPYNQLGNLYLDKNYNLDSVCYYIHCLSCVTPFEGAMGNLEKLFEKNTHVSFNQDSESLTQGEHIQNTIANFFSLIEIWYLNKTEEGIPEKCSTIAQHLKIALEFNKTMMPDVNKNYTEFIQTIEEENNNPTFLNGTLVHKIVQICLFTLSKLSETDEQKAFACKAFTLALLSQLLQKLLSHLEALGLKNPSIRFYKKSLSSKHSTSQISEINDQTEATDATMTAVSDIPVLNGNKDNIVDSIPNNDYCVEDSNILHNGDLKNNIKKTVSKRRRRRRMISSGSSDISDAEMDTSDLELVESDSDEECFSDSTYPSEDDSKSEGSYDNDSEAEVPNEKLNGNSHVPSVEIEEKKILTDNSVIVDDSKSKKFQTSQKEDNDIVLNIEGIQNFLFGDNILPSLKLLQDWALLEKDLIVSCGDSGEPLFQAIVNLMNIFTFYFNPKNSETSENKNCRELIYASNIANKLRLDYKKIPLPEDINLRGTNICKFDKDAAEWQILEKYKPSVFEENVIRILNFIDFGNQIIKIVPRVRYNRTMKIFYLKKTPRPKINTKINHKSREWHNSKKPQSEGGEGGLLRRLGRLWLTSHVRELEKAGRGAAPQPALLALTANALHEHLRRVKQMLRDNNFILLVPTIVLQELDDLKRERSTARDAIRWLEVQLKGGSRFVRAQRPGQSRPLPLIKYPRKAPPHIHNFIQILEFCNHFIADDKNTQGGNGDPDNSLHGRNAPLLILLVGNEGNEEQQYKEFSVMGAAQAAGISVEYIGDFYTKWRQTVQKTGKKR